MTDRGQIKQSHHLNGIRVHPQLRHNCGGCWQELVKEVE